MTARRKLAGEAATLVVLLGHVSRTVDPVMWLAVAWLVAVGGAAARCGGRA